MIGTKDVKTGGSMAKTIMPGAHKNLKLNKVELKRYGWMEKDDAYYLVHHVETQPIEGFEGFFIDPNDESKGRHQGQVGQVKTNSWPYKNDVTKNGTEISRDKDIVRQILQICEEVGPEAEAWFKEADGKFSTIEAFVDAFNEKKFYEGTSFNYTIGCREYEKADSDFVGYDLRFPKMNKIQKAFENANTPPEKSRLIPFDAEEHWERIEGSSEEEETVSDVPEDMLTGDMTAGFEDEGPSFPIEE